jgi:hypothetical protein
MERTGSQIERARTDDEQDAVLIQRRQILLTIGESIEMNELSHDIPIERMQ